MRCYRRNNLTSPAPYTYCTEDVAALMDGDFSTGFCARQTGTGVSVIQFAFPAPVTVARLRLTPMQQRSSDLNSRYIDVSDDGEAWTQGARGSRRGG